MARRNTASDKSRRTRRGEGRGDSSRRGSGNGGRDGPARAGKQRRQQPERPRRRWGRRLFVWALVLMVWAGLGAAGVLVYYAHDLPDVDKVTAETRKPSVTLLAADGSVLASYGQLYGETVTLADLPPALPKAVMAVEDRRFYSHFGVDPLGLARAMVANLRAGGIVQGGSTITQQLAKNLFLTPERTIKRKVQELILALWLERRFSKDDILSLYLNRVYLGAGTYGVDAAARRYFGKPASQVNLYESAMLAGLLKAPSRYNPAADAEAAHRRATVVLNDMVAAGYITEGEAERAARQRSRGRTASAWRGRYFADWVLGNVQSHVGYHPKDLIVQTTLRRRTQRLAEEQVTALLESEGRPHRVGQAALVTMEPDGAVRAMVGGRSYRQSQFNRATQAQRQPGSAFKPFVYLAGMESGLTPDARFEDRPVQIDGWSPENYAGRYYGSVTLREAFARSLNSVAVQVLQRVGAGTVARTAKRLGITSDLKSHPSLALGTSEVHLLELTGAYAVFANGGNGVFPYGIESIRDSDGKLLFSRAGGGTGRIVSPRHVARMTDIMRANVVWGTGDGAAPGRPAAGKTGTSQESRDAWFVGFTAELVTGVWMGNDDGTPMKGVTGGGLPAELWRRVTENVLAGQPARQLPGLKIEVAERREESATQTGDSPGAAGGSRGGSGGDGVIERILRSLGGGGDGRAGAAESAPTESSGRTGPEARGR